MDIEEFSENALTIYMGDDVDEKMNRRLVSLKNEIEAMELSGIEEIVISYTSLIIYYDLFNADVSAIETAVKGIDTDALLQGKFEYKIVEIPVCYGGEYGPDIGAFSEDGLGAEDVIEMHSNTEYIVYMLGFMPGFPYLGGLDERLHKARLSTPRVRIPAGSVGIGGRQTGMYPFESPGGWNLLGRTPVHLFDERRETPILYQAGDRVVYRSISEDEYKEIKALAEQGEYEVKSQVRSEG